MPPDRRDTGGQQRRGLVQCRGFQLHHAIALGLARLRARRRSRRSRRPSHNPRPEAHRGPASRPYLVDIGARAASPPPAPSDHAGTSRAARRPVRRPRRAHARRVAARSALRAGMSRPSRPISAGARTSRTPHPLAPLRVWLRQSATRPPLVLTRPPHIRACAPEGPEAQRASARAASRPRPRSGRLSCPSGISPKSRYQYR